MRIRATVKQNVNKWHGLGVLVLDIRLKRRCYARRGGTECFCAASIHVIHFTRMCMRALLICAFLVREHSVRFSVFLYHSVTCFLKVMFYSQSRFHQFDCYRNFQSFNWSLIQVSCLSRDYEYFLPWRISKVQSPSVCQELSSPTLVDGHNNETTCSLMSAI